ncbi:hypothetical protein TREES_T100001617 [Tupaia chinensis]|uniref:Uncharacterized protein n=1 Tax=Tupaia chinensis TaxID=246437 RepID=L9KJ87_TUPCH|nr:hypothetical protein TREES_T100001617 [Tupaia chinensis]
MGLAGEWQLDEEMTGRSPLSDAQCGMVQERPPSPLHPESDVQQLQLEINDKKKLCTFDRMGLPSLRIM